MARIDDYKQARRLAAEALKEADMKAVAKAAGYGGADYSGATVPFLDRRYRIDFDGFRFVDLDDPSKEVPIQEQVLILHYLKAGDFPEPAGKWVAYREIPGATFYHASFLKRAADPLKGVFGADLDGFRKAARRLDGRALEDGDASYEFRPFPKVPMRAIVWAADEEFDAEASIVFDETVGRMLSPEDIAWMAGMVVYRCMALAR